MDVEVSIVTLGAGEGLRACVARLPSACDDLAWRLTVVDNSSDRQPVEDAVAALPANVIRSEGRRGFGENQNLALARLVREGRARYGLVLNDDTELDPRSVTALVRHADRNPGAAVIGARVRDAHGRQEPGYVAWPTVAEQAVRALLPRLGRSTTRMSGWPNGACMLVRTSALRQVGLFDPSFFLFFEETDLCMRFARAGWTLELCPEASLLHHGGQSRSRLGLNVEIQRQFVRSRRLYFEKHYGRASAEAVTQLVRFALAIRLCKSVAAATLLRSPEARSRARALLELVRYSPRRPTMLELEAARDALR